MEVMDALPCHGWMAMAGPVRKKPPRQPTTKELERDLMRRLVARWREGWKELWRVLRGDPHVPTPLEMVDKIKDEDKLYFLGYDLDVYDRQTDEGLAG